MATGGRGFQLEATQVGVVGVSTDSRTVPDGGLFVALRGEAHDGHRFVAAARERGASVLVAADAGVSGPRIEVADTLVALGALARFFVERSFAADGRRPVLAIGGAAGKTTTKTLAGAAVAALFGRTLVTDGNLNNRIGVPMTLLTLEPRHRALVLECGTSVRGEIAALGAIARPDVALVLNVDLEHSQGLGTLEEIADEEAALLAAASQAAITSSEEPLLLERLHRLERRHVHRLTFGTSADAHFRIVARDIGEDGKTRLRLQLGRQDAASAPSTASPSLSSSSLTESLCSSWTAHSSAVEVETPLLGPAAATNIAAAIAGALALLDRPATAAELASMAAGLGSVEAVPGRLRPVTTSGGALILDDSYNSNPRSVVAALAAALEVVAHRRSAVPGARLILALGDMLELGDFAPAAHDEMVRRAEAASADRLILIGPESSAAALRVRPRIPVRTFADSRSAALDFSSDPGGQLRTGDVLLVKGSRGIRTEEIVSALATTV